MWCSSGSILGPLLFILYINYIAQISKTMELILFANDINICMSDKCLDSLINRINIEITNISKWFIINKLPLNIKNKFTGVLFCNKKVKPSVNILIEQVKFFGVIITKNLTRDNHIKTVCNKVSKGIGIICKIHRVIPPSILINLYFTLVHPYFQYCNIVWASNPTL